MSERFPTAQTYLAVWIGAAGAATHTLQAELKMSDAPNPAAEQAFAAPIKLASYFAASLLLTGLADYFFLRHAIGWTAGLFYMAFLFVAVFF
jgi:hypothetical protein